MIRFMPQVQYSELKTTAGDIKPENGMKVNYDADSESSSDSEFVEKKMLVNGTNMDGSPV